MNSPELDKVDYEDMLIKIEVSDVKLETESVIDTRELDVDPAAHLTPRAPSSECDVYIETNEDETKIEVEKVEFGESDHFCFVCRITCNELESYKSHLEIAHGLLRKNSPTQNDLDQNKLNASEEKSLTEHVKRKYFGKKPFQCNFCKARFTYRSNLTIHVRRHTGERPFKCEICQSIFTQKVVLTKHVRTHTGEKPFKCEICKMNYAQESSLIRHMRSHDAVKPFNCVICKLGFMENDCLTDHMTVHAGKKSFDCEICTASFTQNSNLIVHMRKHTGEKPFRCEICKFSFTQKCNLNKHLKTQHALIHTG